MTTDILTTNKGYETIGIGEINILKDVALRTIKMEFILPGDINLPFVQPRYATNCILDKPITYLNMLRRFKEEKKPFRLMITRILPNGEEIFKTNIKVSLESYTVFEKAGEEGDFSVLLTLKEFRENETKKIIQMKNGGYTIQKSRSSKDTPKSYVVKKGDTLWDIAKRELNDEKLFKKIMQMNNITEPRKLKIGSILKLP